MLHTVRSKWRLISDRSSLHGLIVRARVGSFMPGPGGLPVSGQSQSKPVIQWVATGGTVAKTRHGQIPIQQTIAEIRNKFPRRSGSRTAREARRNLRAKWPPT